MAALGGPTFVDAQGTAHDWRADLLGALAQRQDANGSWVNPTDSFMEGEHFDVGLKRNEYAFRGCDAATVIRNKRPPSDQKQANAPAC